TIVGVTRKWFAGMDMGAGPDVTIPLTAAPAVTGGDIDLNSRNSFWISATGRLKDGITIERARTQLESVWPVVLSEAAPADYSGERRQRFLSYRLDVSSAANGIDLYLRSHFSQPLYVLMGAVGMILLVACVNLANLMLARTSARSQEMTVRIALGASRWRLVRQVLTESLLLSAAGASLGLVFAWWASRILANFMTQLSITPVFLNLTPDLRILLVTVTVAII